MHACSVAWCLALRVDDGRDVQSPSSSHIYHYSRTPSTHRPSMRILEIKFTRCDSGALRSWSLGDVRLRSLTLVCGIATGLLARTSGLLAWRWTLWAHRCFYLHNVPVRSGAHLNTALLHSVQLEQAKCLVHRYMSLCRFVSHHMTPSQWHTCNTGIRLALEHTCAGTIAASAGLILPILMRIAALFYIMLR